MARQLLAALRRHPLRAGAHSRDVGLRGKQRMREATVGRACGVRWEGDHSEYFRPFFKKRTISGATSDEIERHAVVQCTSDTPVCGEPCSICLVSIESGDLLRGLQVTVILAMFMQQFSDIYYLTCDSAWQCDPPHFTHYFHRACIDEWLGIKGSCPLCKFEVVAT